MLTVTWTPQSECEQSIEIPGKDKADFAIRRMAVTETPDVRYRTVSELVIAVIDGAGVRRALALAADKMARANGDSLSHSEADRAWDLYQLLGE